MTIKINSYFIFQTINICLLFIILYSIIYFMLLNKFPSLIEIIISTLLFLFLYITYLMFVGSFSNNIVYNNSVSVPSISQDIKSARLGNVLDLTKDSKKPWEVCMGLLDAKSADELIEISKELQITTSDEIIKRDKSSLNNNYANNPNESRRLSALINYPFMTGEQINKHDCLNDLGNSDSCFQSPNLFNNLNNISSIKKKSNINNEINNTSEIINFDNKKIKEGFTSDIITSVSKNSISKSFTSPYQEFPIAISKDFEAYPMKDLYKNTPEYLNNKEILIPECNHCKMGLCYNNYCGFQNKFFM